MRIAYIINSMEGGGAAFPIPSILSLMRSYGAEVKIFALTKKDGKALPAIYKANLPVVVRDGGIEDHFQTFSWLNRSIIDYQPTHLWTSLTRATLLGQLVGLYQKIPVISWQHAAYLKPWNLKLLRATRSLSKLWICDSERVTTFTQQYLKIPKYKIITWPIFKANTHAPQAHPWQKKQIIKIISMGRLHPVKGYDILIKACNLLNKYSNVPEYTLSIYGDGPEYQSLTNLIKDYHVENYIKLAGFTPDVAETLSQYHLYIQPSRSEGFCVAAHEAMLAGLPIIASAVGELSLSIKNDKSGFTVPPADPIALAKILYQTLQCPERLYSMGQCAREIVTTKFSSAHFNNVGRQIFDHINLLTPQ